MYPLKGTGREKNRPLRTVCARPAPGLGTWNLPPPGGRVASRGCPTRKAALGRLGSPQPGLGGSRHFFCVCVYTLLAVGVSLVSAHVQGMEPSICRDCLRGRWASGPRSEYLTPRKASTVILPPVWVLANSPQAFWGRLLRSLS